LGVDASLDPQRQQENRVTVSRAVEAFEVPGLELRIGECTPDVQQRMEPYAASLYRPHAFAEFCWQVLDGLPDGWLAGRHGMESHSDGGSPN